MLARRTFAALAASSLAVMPVAGAANPQRAYDAMTARVSQMVDDEGAVSKANAFGLQILNVLWEDTGRWLGSSVGPNISDVTIEVEGYHRGNERHTYLMPVMRYDDFTDKTADVKIEKILIPVGNQYAHGQLQLVTLKELLENPEQYMTSRDKGRIKDHTLLAKRDTHALVSAQHAFLPVPKEGKATFWPVIFNYQSSQNNPAVLTILVTRQGTSMTIIDNHRDAVQDTWGQRLYFNNGGQKAPLIAERMTDVQASGVTANGESAASLDDNANVLMLIQVPLKYREPDWRMKKAEIGYGDGFGAGAGLAADKPMAAPKAATASSSIASGTGGGRAAERSDVDTAVLGHGQDEGPFVELDNRTIERDARFPVRVTLQFYQATSNGVVSKANVKAMAQQIRKVYAKGDFVGSLVVPNGLDRQRPTNWAGVTHAMDVTWRDFPGLVERFHAGLMLHPRGYMF